MPCNLHNRSKKVEPHWQSFHSDSQLLSASICAQIYGKRHPKEEGAQAGLRKRKPGHQRRTGERKVLPAFVREQESNKQNKTTQRLLTSLGTVPMMAVSTSPSALTMAKCGMPSTRKASTCPARGTAAVAEQTLNGKWGGGMRRVQKQHSRQTKLPSKQGEKHVQV